MQLSLTERWILVNQYLILETLRPEDAKSLCERREALERGYEHLYEWACAEIDKEAMTREESSEILDILEMFSTLKRSYESLNDKSGIEPSHIEFPGFDGSVERKQLMYTRYYCGLEGGRFEALDRGHNFNSHWPRLDRYRKMLEEWRGMGKKGNLAKEDILQIATTK